MIKISSLRLSSEKFSQRKKCQSNCSNINPCDNFLMSVVGLKGLKRDKEMEGINTAMMLKTRRGDSRERDLVVKERARQPQTYRVHENSPSLLCFL